MWTPEQRKRSRQTVAREAHARFVRIESLVKQYGSVQKVSDLLGITERRINQILKAGRERTERIRT